MEQKFGWTMVTEVRSVKNKLRLVPGLGRI